jgi:hypothetical protein
MSTYLIMAAMKGDFLAKSGNIYNNFQMLGYVDSNAHDEAVKIFFNNPQFPIDWQDVIYIWAESLGGDDKNGHYGELDKIYVEDLNN